MIGRGGKKIGRVVVLELGLEGLKGRSLLGLVVLKMLRMLMLRLLGLICSVVIHGKI